LASQPSTAERARAKYEEGVRLFDGKHNLQGMEAFVEATEMDPNCVDAWVALGRTFYSINPEKYVDRIMECAQNALKAEPNNPKSKSLAVAAFLKKGELAAATDEWFLAYSHFKRAYHLDPDGKALSEDNLAESIHVLDAYSWAAEHAGKFREFVTDLRARVTENSKDQYVKYIIGRTLTKMSAEIPGSEERQESLNEAEIHLTKFLVNDPLNAEANYFLGFVYVGQGRTRLAAEIVAKLADIDIERSRDLREVLED
jgi:tetratricopeptide (TPR) repeat protein